MGKSMLMDLVAEAPVLYVVAVAAQRCVLVGFIGTMLIAK
jgi:hypothetical protein